MKLNDYQNVSRRTLTYLTDQTCPSPNLVSLVWNALGLAGEAGEVADTIKKVVFHGKDVDAIIIEKELGDVLWYVSAIASCLGLSLEQIAQTNIEKLKARYPEGWDASRSHRPGETAIEERTAHECFGAPDSCPICEADVRKRAGL
jgi:NTP pyrophosphatase (non-canonical NTP hydrolase)